MRSLSGKRLNCVYKKVPNGVGSRGKSWKMGDSTSNPAGEY